MTPKAAATDTVLVVDDTPSNLQVLFTYLEGAGFTVLLAQNGQRALQIINVLLPDLILLDVLMPDINGLEICRQLKNQVTTQEIPIIFLTALSETNHKVQGFAVGGVDYITKPIDQQEVIARIKTHLALRHIRQNLLERNQELQQEIKSRQQIEIKLQQALNAEASIRLITERIRDSLDEKQVLQTINQELVDSLKLRGCQIEFYQSDRNSSIIVNEQGKTISSADSFIKQVADSSQIYRQLIAKVSLQFATHIPQLNFLEQQLTCLVCPIFDNQEPISFMGNLWLLRSPEEVFSSWEIKLVEQIASQCAIAIRQARLYQQSQAQVAELARLNRLKDDFLKTISHELRSPMSSIQLAVQTLEKLLAAEYPQARSPMFEKVLTIFRQSCNKQNQLVNDLLTLCYLDAQAETIAIVTEWIDLPSWIPKIIEPFQERIKNQQQQIILDIPFEAPQLKSNPFILERIIQELVNNACKYTPAQETISLQVKSKNKTIILNIQNSGIEIPLEERERIFERFYRIPNNDPWQYGGTGLGLHLVKKLLELIQGQISVKSKSSLTTFSLKLPVVF